MRLDFIRPLYERRGPYASVYLGALTEPERESSWRGVRDRLGGADPATIEALHERAVEPAVAMFATHGDVVLSERLSEPPGELATWSPLPHVTPMLMRRGENVPHLRVIVDHAGAELTVFGGGSPRTSTLRAESWPLQKTAQGGWSQRRYENSVESTWEKNVALVAGEIDDQVRRIGAELVIVAGDPKSRAMLCDHLGTKAADRVMMVEHGSHSDRGGFELDVESALDEWLEGRRAELLDRHREAAGPVGPRQVFHALREGRVHAVLSPGELPEPVWIGDGGTQLAPEAEELRLWGVEQPVTERADSALARAAAMTDAELWFSDEVSDVAAVIRY
ncbi:Vms1/Ankzf1 family peptidyl-tRNA hydrolase [Nonomuraea lactucae]|uniref:baeRF2 domain-containing protein n=1 Tax=Nonomuraea lactucae TaxID=2249762 RepID=UPI000DE55022|nr:Vms1/Ankzf1 family peptidyl-tRNA hydrolase [Nonomuraea lactucae]